MSIPVWTPKHAPNSTIAMTQWMNQINQQYHLTLGQYTEFHQWSISHLNEFWDSIWSFCEILGTRSPQPAMIPHPSWMAKTQWFPGSTLNFARNLLRRHDGGIAIWAADETGSRRTLTFAELQHQVAAVAAYFRSLGIQPKDRIVGVLPNIPEAIIAMLAAARIGAIWSACSPDFGVEGLLDRFEQIEPSVLLMIDRHHYKGTRFDHTERNQTLIQKLPTVKQVILIAEQKSSQSSIISWEEVLQHPPLLCEDFPEFPFDHPLYILYTSGTTGKPKCMVHGAGNTLIEHLKELKLHTNVMPNQRFFFHTTPTWMMWHWMVSNLALGATLVLYEGSPFYPKMNSLFDVMDEAEVNFMGVGAKFIEGCLTAGLKPRLTHRLSSLQTMLTTGSPLLPACYDYIERDIKPDLQISSISGGSDIIGCFALGNPLLPVYRGELQCLGLGLAVSVFDEHGNSVQQQKGELVCTQPFPSMPRFFWNDSEDQKYHRAYFEQFPHVWTHGDFAEITEHQGLIIYGRSDATLNPSGVRIGTAEIYQQLNKIDDVMEGVAVGKMIEGNESIILFVILKENHTLSPELIQRIKTVIRQNTSPYHVPSKIIAVPDFPRTPNGKIAETAIKRIVNGESVTNRDALANPDCLEFFKPTTD